jgi:hypothetical protein
VWTCLTAVGRNTAAVEDEDSLLQDTAKNVVAPSEESELESQASSECIEELVSSDSEGDRDDSVLNMEYQVEECGYEDEDDTALGPDEEAEDESAGERSSASSATLSSQKSGVASGSGSRSGSGSYSRSMSRSRSGSRSGSMSGSEQSSLTGSGAVSGSGSANSGSEKPRSRSSSGSQKSSESHESAQELFFRLMMGKDGVVSSGEKKRKSGTACPSSSSENSTTSEVRKDNAIIQASPMSESPGEIVPPVPSPVPMMASKEDILLSPTEGSHEPHVSAKSPALLDPTTAKTAGWMSTSVMEKMKQNPSRRRVSSGGRGGGWRGLPGAPTPSPTSPAPVSHGAPRVSSDEFMPMSTDKKMDSNMDGSPSPVSARADASPESTIEESGREGDHTSGYEQDVGTDRCTSAPESAPPPATTTAPNPSSPPQQKGFFKFSSSLREGMDMFYRATGSAAANTATSDDDNSDG